MQESPFTVGALNLYLKICLALKSISDAMVRTLTLNSYRGDNAPLRLSAMGVTKRAVLQFTKRFACMRFGVARSGWRILGYYKIELCVTQESQDPSSAATWDGSRQVLVLMPPWRSAEWRGVTFDKEPARWRLCAEFPVPIGWSVLEDLALDLVILCCLIRCCKCSLLLFQGRVSQDDQSRRESAIY